MASTIKVDTVQNQPGTNIINKCGTTITIGASSDTVALATGASQSGFGQTYSAVSWVTDSIKTATFTAVAGKGYFCNTTGGAFEVDLDSQGRLLIPPQLRKLLGDERNIAVIGCGDYVELWPLSVWEKELENQD